MKCIHKIIKQLKPQDKSQIMITILSSYAYSCINLLNSYNSRQI